MATTSMEWISILKCPITKQELRRAVAEEVDAINSRIAGGRMWQVNGEPMGLPITDCLITSDQKYVYPIKEDILILLRELALVESPPQKGAGLVKDKALVRNFYDSQGWNQDKSGKYKDADLFEDMREVSREYIANCHARVKRYIPSSGKYLLDAASGALQYDDYLPYSEEFDYRICVDLSISGLLECKRKLGKKAICILCDITELPFKDNQIDGFVSLNTIYHIPKDEQVEAIRELYRVTKPLGSGVVVYDWYKHSLWMNVALLPFRAVRFIAIRATRLFSRLSKTEPGKMLYFYAHTYDFLKKELPPFKLVVWRSVSVPFMKFYIHRWLFGKSLLAWIWKYEERNPEKCGLRGEYPMFFFEKK